MKGLVLTYLLTWGGAAVALFNPLVGVCVYWILDIVRPQYMFAWAGTRGEFSQIVAIATIVGWALNGFGNWRLLRGRTVVILFIAYTAWTLVSAALAPNSDVALLFVQAQLKRSIMFIVAATLVDSVPRVRTLAWVLTGSAGYLALELNLRYFAGLNEAQLVGYGGQDNNSLAISMVTCLGVAAFLGLSARSWWQKAIALTSAALIAHTVLLTFSRGGMLGMIVAGLVGAVVMPKRPKYVLALACGLFAIVSVSGPDLRARFLSTFADEGERDGSAQGRVELWLDTVEVMERYPLFGVGPDHFPLIAEEFGWEAGKEAHSLWFQLGAEIGIPGTILLLIFYLATVRRLWPLARNGIPADTDGWVGSMARMVVTSLAGFIVSVQFVTMEGLETPLYVTVLGVGILRSVSKVVEADGAAASLSHAIADVGPVSVVAVNPGMTRGGS